MSDKRGEFILVSIVKFLLLGVLIVSCRSEVKECSGEKLILMPNEKNISITLDFTKPKEELETEIRVKVPSSDIKAPVRFGLELNGKTYNSSIHAPHINQFTCYGMPAMRHKSPQLEVLMNKNHKLMIDGRHRMEIDSLANFIGWYFPNDAPFGEKIVKFQCDSECSSIKIEKCIEAIADGYMSYYRKEAAANYLKNICELYPTEREELSKKYPFELRLWLGDPPPVMIPPVIQPTVFSGTLL
ncbi:MAG: hypothetical protein ACI8QW_000257 [Saprospiraceae bacterium]|jgi:hypothetical protein